jgi:hypothetical protein
VAGKTHSGRSTTTARSTPRHATTIVEVDSSLSRTSLRIGSACSPISRKTLFSSRCAMVLQ